MKIAIDCRMLEREKGGLFVILYNLLQCIKSIDDENLYDLYFDNVPENYDYLISEKFKICKIIGPSFLKKNYVLTSLILLPLSFLNKKYDIFYSPYYFGPIFSPVKIKIISPWDISYTTHPKHYSLKNQLILHTLSKYTSRNANGLVTCSKYDKEIINKYYKIENDRIFVLPLSVDKLFLEEINKEYLDIYLKRNDLKNKYYFLSIGTIYNRRNVDILIKAFKNIIEIDNKMKLVIVGRNMTNPTINFDELIVKNNLSNNIKRIERVTDEELKYLYIGAKYNYCTSTVDGETIINKESLACGTPVITNSLLIRSIDGHAIICEDPSSIDSVTLTLINAIKNYSSQIKVANKGKEFVQKLTWEKSAKEFLNFIDLVVKRKENIYD